MPWLYKGSERSLVPDIDCPGWIAAGWSMESVQPVKRGEPPVKVLELPSKVWIYKDGSARQVFQIDADGFLSQGWSLSPPVADSEAVTMPLGEPANVQEETQEAKSLLDLLNNGSFDELVGLPSVGVSIANQIIELRPPNGYASVDEVKAMKLPRIKWVEIEALF